MNTHSDPWIGLVVVLVLIHATRRPQPVHRITAIALILITGILLWANLRPTGWQEEFGGVESPRELDPITRAMFWRVAALSLYVLPRSRPEIPPQSR